MKKPHPHIGRKCYIIEDDNIYTITGVTIPPGETIAHYIINSDNPFDPWVWCKPSGSVNLLPETTKDTTLAENEESEKKRKQSWPTDLTMDDVTLAENVHVKPRTWIRIDKTRISSGFIFEQEGVLRNLIYLARENTIDYDLTQDDGTEKHMTIILPDCAEVTIGRTFDN
jgi:hypothetical protein